VTGAESAGLTTRHANGNSQSPAATVRVEATVALGEKVGQVEIRLRDGTTSHIPVFLVGE